MRLFVVMAIVLGFFAAGCGAAAPPTATMGPTKAEKKRKQHQRKARDARRGRVVMRYYHNADVIKRYAIDDVEVDDDIVTVHTGLYPKSSSRPMFTGACTMLMGYAGWIGSVRIEGRDGLPYAQWSRGGNLCRIYDL